MLYQKCTFHISLKIYVGRAQLIFLFNKIRIVLRVIVIDSEEKATMSSHHFGFHIVLSLVSSNVANLFMVKKAALHYLKKKRNSFKTHFATKCLIRKISSKLHNHTQ